VPLPALRRVGTYQVAKRIPELTRDNMLPTSVEGKRYLAKSFTPHNSRHLLGSRCLDEVRNNLYCANMEVSRVRAKIELQISEPLTFTILA